MKKLAILVSSILLSVLAHSQALKKYPIGNSGCSAYMYCNPGEFAMEFSEDSSKVYTSECLNEGLYYGVICVKLLNKVDSLRDAEVLLTAYLDYLKVNFNVKNSAGYGKGYKLNKNEKTAGILDFWKDMEGNNWKVKGWTDGKFIGVMYVYGKKELPETKVNAFLEGFRFP